MKGKARRLLNELLDIEANRPSPGTLEASLEVKDRLLAYVEGLEAGISEREEPPRPSLDRVYEGVLAFNDEFFPGWRKTSLLYVSNAMAGESGEVSEDVLGLVLASTTLSAKVGKLADLVKHLYGGGTHDTGATFVDVAEEGVDVFFYLILLFGALGAEREAFVGFVEKKLAKVRRRMEERGGHGRAP